LGRGDPPSWCELSSFATALATTTGSTTSTPAPATSSTPSSAPTLASRPVTQGGTVATLFCHYYKSKTHEIQQCRRRPSHRKGGSSTSADARSSSSQQLPEWVLELTRRMDCLKCVWPLPIHPWSLLLPRNLVSFHNQLGHLGSLLILIL
jgi:hypothetical protein